MPAILSGSAGLASSFNALLGSFLVLCWPLKSNFDCVYGYV
jgi:hypothetical protein